VEGQKPSLQNPPNVCTYSNITLPIYTYMTIKPMQEDVDIFKQHGANAVLAKPLRIETFESMVRTNHSSGSFRVVPFEWFHSSGTT
jgi:hypothetical protein